MKKYVRNSLSNANFFVDLTDLKEYRWQLNFGDFIRHQVSEDAFYICNLGEIIKKNEEWKDFMPRVKPFYGKSLIFVNCGSVETANFE